jgi:hypothetical protein
MFNSGWSGGNNNSDNEIGTMLAWLGGIGIAGMAAKKIIDKLTESLREFKAELADTAAETEKIRVVGADIGMTDTLTPLLAVLGVTAAGVIGVEEAIRRYYRAQAKQRVEYFQIIPHAETGVNGERISNLISAFHQMNRTLTDRIKRGREWFQLYFVCVDDPTRGEDGRIEIYCGFPRDRFTYVKKKIMQAFPDCGLKRMHWSKVPHFVGKGTGGYIRFRDGDKKGFPLKEFKGSDQITGILDCLTPGSAFAVTFSPAAPRELKATIRKTRKWYYKEIGYNPREMRKSDLDADVQRDIEQLNARERQTKAFSVKLAVWQSEEAADAVYSIRDEINSRLGGDNNEFHLKRTLSNPIQIVPYSWGIFDWVVELLDGIPYTNLQRPMTMVAAELANLIHLPQGMTAEQRAMKKRHLYNRIDHIIPGQSDIPHDEFTQGVKFGYLLNPAQDYRPIHLLEDVMRKMGVIIGKTGSGKTAIALMACIHVILERLQRKNGGLTVVDPKRTFAYTLLTWLNKLKMEGVLQEEHEQLFRFYDVTSKEFCFSINPMEKPRPNLTEEEKMEIVSNTLEVLMSTYPNDSILFERYGSVAIKALLEDPQQQHNILAISEFIDKVSPLRDRLYNFLRHGNAYQKGIAREIERLQKGFGGTDCQTVYNRLHRLASNPRTKRIFGQSQTTIKPLECMEQGLISVYNIEGLKQSEIKLVMGFIAMEYHKWANHRKNRAENHYLWVDEAHEVQLPVMWEKIVPKDREMGLCLWLLTQSLHQFKEPLLDAMKEIGGSFVSCIAGEESAKVMQKITTGRVKALDIQNYRALTGVIDTEDSSGDRVTFMIKADPPFVWDANGQKTYYGPDRQRRDDEKNAAYENAWNQLGRKWMERDCRPVNEVDEEIAAYLESLWSKPKIKIDQAEEETAVTSLEEIAGNNVVNFQSKKETKAAVGESPFAHLFKESEDE